MFDWLIGLAISTSRPELAPALDVPARLPIAAPAHLAGPVRKDALRVGVATNAAAVVLVDRETGAVLFGKRADEPRSVASLTKLVTVLVALDGRPNFDEEVTITSADLRRGGIEQIFSGDVVTMRDLFNLALVASSNTAAATLARVSGGTPEEFAAKMNAKAKEIGMTHAAFVEPTGLDTRNKASATDVARLLSVAFGEPVVRDAARKSEYRFTTVQGKPRAARATDELLGSFLDKPPYRLLGGKTGYLQEAGYCFGAIAENGNGDGLVAVALGAATREQRFTEVQKLLYWGFDAFAWPGREVARK
jgi:D-alanyl-D-alanine carboxypeptidase